MPGGFRRGRKWTFCCTSGPGNNWSRFCLFIALRACSDFTSFGAVCRLKRLKRTTRWQGSRSAWSALFYSLLLAFVIVAAWERYDRADESIRHEAIGLTELYRLGADFDEPTCDILEHSTREYLRSIIEQDWPEMANDAYRTQRDYVGAMGLWKIVSDYKPSGARQQPLVEKSFDALSQVSDARAMRSMYYSENLPDMVWMVIYVGLFITVGFGYFFALDTFKSQALMCATFSGLLGLTILAILELAHPYQGRNTISTFPLVYAEKRMNAIDRIAGIASAELRLGLARRWKSIREF